jgi:serine/threonine protein kinase
MTTGPFTTDPLIDVRLGNYRIIRSLGMGGMGKVYVAQDETLKRSVALKVIREQYRAREDYRARLMGEATAIANLKHPNIVQIYAAGEQHGILYFAMELISGQNLKDLLNETLATNGGINFDAVIQIGTAVASALDYAHEQGVIHRDLKPANVIITHNQHVYLTDFGLAHDTRDFAQAVSTAKEGGTPQYMSPEQIDPVYPVGPASDQYSLGVMLFEMFTGTVPFEGDDPESIYQKHLNNPPPKPLSLNRKLTPEIQEILLRALAKHPADRFENCMTLMSHLARVWQTAQETLTPQHIPLPALPAGTRARHGLPTEPSPLPAQKSRPTDQTLPIPDKRVAEHTRTRATENTRPRTFENMRPRPTAPIPQVSKPKTSRREDRVIWAGLGAVGMVIILLMLYFGFQFLTYSNLLSLSPPPTATRPLTITPLPQPFLTATLPAIAPPADHTPTPTQAIPSPTPTASLSPTSTEVSGDPFLLLYDDTSFNLLNLSDRSRNISLLAFERLDNFGASLESFTGSQWARFNNLIRPQTCMRIKLSSALFLTSPEECNNIFDAEVTISPHNESDFWTIQPDSTEFRVLWSNVEIERCVIRNRRCEILIP